MIKQLVKFRLGMISALIGTVALGFLLIFGILGYFLGFSEVPYIITGALIILTAISILQWLFGPALIKSIYKLHQISPQDPTYGWVYNIVQEVAVYNRISPPKVYLADVPFPNAFAFSSPLYGKNVAITLPLLRILTPEEIKAVLGHELGHLKHRDTELLLAVGLIPTLLYWIGYSLWWSGFLGGGGGRNNNSGGSLFLVGILLIGISYLFSLLVLFLNRMRESYADINAALTVPQGAKNLQTALAKIVISSNPKVLEKMKRTAGGSIGKMLFFSSLEGQNISSWDAEELIQYWRTQKVGILSDFLSDHPHPAKRIKMLDKFYFH
ncbi:zinc metalloprotease HtpX [Stygiolobus caldivivus]|uniref:Protease HtpX homolog n=1 Tax=Stygiolobus caldivivus TaxID=2824673 RepID=A0A8D5ZIM2_9CREN|nr:zinc metalloprotease HtpX [Stygiolobus caldivivus]BCU69392.1 heat-shock protein HtpX [Stygiolobus caldivivus]